jgi:hypothetical protein
MQKHETINQLKLIQEEVIMASSLWFSHLVFSIVDVGSVSAVIVKL